MSSIVIVDGPTCTGKTTLVNFLSEKLGLKKYAVLLVPSEFGDINGCIAWSSPNEGWAEYMVVANLWRLGCDVILDRGMLSWCLYNGHVEFLDGWFSLLRNWDRVSIVCLLSSKRNIIKNMDDKGELQIDKLSSKEAIDGEIVGFKKLFDIVPMDLGFKYVIEDYQDFCKEEIEDLIRDKWKLERE